MPGKTNYWANAALAATVGQTNMPAAGTVYLGLLTSVGNDYNSFGFVEPSGNGYARISLSAKFGSPIIDLVSGDNQIKNTSSVTFPISTGSWGDIIAIGYYDSLTGGNLREWDYIGNNPWQPFIATAASPSILSCPGHGLISGDKVAISGAYGGVLPLVGQASATGGNSVVRFTISSGVAFGSWTLNGVTQPSQDGGILSGWFDLEANLANLGTPACVNFNITTSLGASGMQYTYSSAAGSVSSDIAFNTITFTNAANTAQLALNFDNFPNAPPAIPNGISLSLNDYYEADLNNKIRVSGGGTPPYKITASSWFGLLPVSVIDGNTLSVGVNALAPGSGMLRKVVSQTILGGTTFSADAGALSLCER